MAHRSCKIAISFSLLSNKALCSGVNDVVTANDNADVDDDDGMVPDYVGSYHIYIYIHIFDNVVVWCV